jgi:hypothetical protein
VNADLDMSLNLHLVGTGERAPRPIKRMLAVLVRLLAEAGLSTLPGSAAIYLEEIREPGHHRAGQSDTSFLGRPSPCERCRRSRRAERGRGRCPLDGASAVPARWVRCSRRTGSPQCSMPSTVDCWPSFRRTPGGGGAGDMDG